MSVNLMSAIFQTEFFDLTNSEGQVTKASTAKLILLAMADCANDQGEGAYPSIPTLSRKTALSEQTIRNTFETLSYNGIITEVEISRYGTHNHTINANSFPKSIGKEVTRLTLYPLDPQTSILTPSNGCETSTYPFDPNHITIHKTTDVSLSKEELDQVNKQVDAMIDSAKHDTWQGRELIRDNLLPLADWYNRTTGQVMTKRVQKSWWKALQDWQDEGLAPEHLQTAYDAQSKWRTVSDPNQLTKDACAVKAAGNATKNENDFTRLL